MIFTTKTELEKLSAREIELWNQKRGLTLELQAAEKTAGEAFADGSAEVEVAAVVALKAKLAALDLGITTVRARRPEAILKENREQANALRGQASEKRRELTTLLAKVNKLWAQLNDLEQVNYAEDIVGLRNTTRSEVLELAVQELENKAVVLEGAPVADMAQLQLNDVTDDVMVIEAVLTHRSAGPSAEAVQAWLDLVKATARKRSAEIEGHSREVTLNWRNGEILTDGSTVFVRSLAKVANLPGALGFYRSQPGTFDVASATFRAAA